MISVDTTLAGAIQALGLVRVGNHYTIDGVRVRVRVRRRCGLWIAEVNS